MGFGRFLGRTMLVLTTRGRNTGRPRHTMVSYVRVGGRDYILSGWGPRAQWFRNLQASPRVSVQTGLETYSANARLVESEAEFADVAQRMLAGFDSHFEPWLESLDIRPDLEDLTAKRERVHLLALDRTVQPGPAPLEVDLLWLWPLLALTFVLGWVAGRLEK
jgi:deazaflavin-dependent oxidoreductase (nitroreductase family)